VIAALLPDEHDLYVALHDPIENAPILYAELEFGEFGRPAQTKAIARRLCCVAPSQIPFQRITEESPVPRAQLAELPHDIRAEKNAPSH
jgi:hypothetical protein